MCVSTNTYDDDDDSDNDEMARTTTAIGDQNVIW